MANIGSIRTPCKKNKSYLNQLCIFPKKVSKIFTFSLPISVLNTHFICPFGVFGKILVITFGW